MRPLSLFSNLVTIFYCTTNYTEDYDSGDYSGDVNNGADAYDPGDYPASLHRPSEVNRSGGMSSTELTITADDLVPYAIKRVAELYRLWYAQVDGSSPVVNMTYPSSEDLGNPTIRTSLDGFVLAAVTASS